MKKRKKEMKFWQKISSKGAFIRGAEKMIPIKKNGNHFMKVN